VTDKISIQIDSQANEDLKLAIQAFSGYIQEEVQATSLQFTELLNNAQEMTIEEEVIRVALARI